jgi:hypothetical protein
MNKLFFLVVIVFFNCSNKSNTKNATINSFVLKEDSIICVNKNLKMVLFLKDSKFEKFKLYNTEKNLKLEGKLELITIDGEIPEGTNRIDYNNPSDYKGFVCDSSYQFISSNVKVSFALEKNSKKRLDLTIYDSKNKDFKNGDYTLVNQK